MDDGQLQYTILGYFVGESIMATKQLILLRHAKSDWYSVADTDHDRPLNDRGRRDAPQVGNWLSQNDYRPEHILCSGAERTRQTLSLLIHGSGWENIPVDISKDLYHAREASLVERIAAGFSYCNTLMVVGHNPGMDMVVMRFCPQIEPGANGKLMTTAACAVIGFDDEDLTNPGLIDFRRP